MVFLGHNGYIGDSVSKKYAVCIRSEHSPLETPDVNFVLDLRRVESSSQSKFYNTICWMKMDKSVENFI